MTDKDKPTGKADASSQVQGEGDYVSARRFRKDEEQFVKTADVDKLAHQAAPKSEEEAEELKRAEEIARSHSADKHDPRSKQ